MLPHNADVRDLKALEGAASRCVEELGGIDFVMYASYSTEKSRMHARALLTSELAVLVRLAIFLHHSCSSRQMLFEP